ncbi:hypothetical protein M427DRAFT_57270 [Gonapodya prolifera JEL478]|uniref:Uncharacterized protein n=1 Tax=Gonapodya prolifera (strain JEL478) TaxID=1344416 RepID=A0A139ADJ5_GONPJ|nr:hypothetical protein M427DRAFT_57270 [Gonapodya prolifera JEL478]|eukprot:KXS14871.1 hypothetical protein M427DRAFT_57270 [Gonapodya prolifera JEL478]
MLLRPRKIGTALVDVHQDNDAALLADVDTGMSTGVEFLFGGGANPEYTWWEKAMRLAKRRKFRSVVDIMKRHGDKASWTES